MRRMQALLTIATAVLLPGVSRAQSAVPAPVSRPKYRTVMHLNGPDPRLWSQAVGNSLDMKRLLGKDNVDVRIVVHGLAIGALKYNSPADKLVAAAIEQGVTVLACQKTMKDNMIEKEDMLPNIGYVPGGLKEVMDRQLEGWLYQKAD